MEQETVFEIPINNSNEKLNKAIALEDSFRNVGIHFDIEPDVDGRRIWHFGNDTNNGVMHRVKQAATKLGCKTHLSEVICNDDLVNMNGISMQHDDRSRAILSKIFDINGNNY